MNAARRNPIHMAVLCATVLVVLFAGLTTPSTTLVDIFYFNPDSSQSNLGGLKRQVEDFFNRTDFPANFQPFAHYVDFDQTVRAKRPSFLFLPGWYFRLYGEKLGLRPLLTPLSDGSPTYRKVLLSRKGAAVTMDTLGGRSLAMTTMGPDRDRILNSILFSAYQADASALNIVTVPKDADALFALALGHVDLALVGRQSMAMIGAANPKIVTAVQTLAESAPIPGPVLCYAPDKVPTSTARQLKQILQHPGTHNSILEILQIDGWLAVGQ